MLTQRITVHRAEGTWVVRAGGAVIGETHHALELLEENYLPVIYFPREDLGMAFLDRSETTSTCPFKGAASYYSIVTKSGVIADAGWSCEDRSPAWSGSRAISPSIPAGSPSSRFDTISARSVRGNRQHEKREKRAFCAGPVFARQVAETARFFRCTNHAQTMHGT